MTHQCKHIYKQTIGHMLMLDKFTCVLCGHVKYYQGGVGWVDGGMRTGEITIFAAGEGTGKSMLGDEDGN